MHGYHQLHLLINSGGAHVSKKVKTAQIKLATYHLEQVSQNEALQTLQPQQRNLMLPPCPVPCHSAIIQGDLDGVANQHQQDTPTALTVLTSWFTGCKSPIHRQE